MQREKHTIDASGQSVGRLATHISVILRGKNKPEFEPHIDNGDTVEVVHGADVNLSGNKLEQKKYYRYSGYRGGLKETKASEAGSKKIIENAVWNMLPKNKLRKNMFKRLIVRD